MQFPTAVPQEEPYTRHQAGDFEIFSHSPDYIEALLQQSALTRLKLQKCFVGEDVFIIWVVQKSG
jgi:hypothetical protein